MSRKDYILIAATIAALPPKMRETVAKAFLESLAGTNPLFDKGRFFAACNKA